jgi:hypothetical protein
MDEEAFKDFVPRVDECGVLLQSSSVFASGRSGMIGEIGGFA